MSPRAIILDSVKGPSDIFEDPDHFGDSLRRNVILDKRGPTLIVLEGLSTDWVGHLQRILNLPSEVIALHKKWPGDHAAGRCRVPLGKSPDQHAVLRYRQPLPFRLRDKRKGISFYPKIFHKGRLLIGQDCRYYLAGDPIRTIDSPIRKVDGQAADSTTQLVTFWRRDHDLDTAWVGILLVDPCPTISDSIREEEIGGPHQPKPAKVQVNPARISRRHYESALEFGRLETPSEGTEKTQSRTSFFDELMALNDTNTDSTEGSSLVDIFNANCHRLVLTKEAAATLVIRSETISLTLAAANGLKDVSDFNFDKFDEKAWRDDWRGEFFTDLWELREDLELFGQELRHNSLTIKRAHELNKETSVKSAKIHSQITQDLLEWEGLAEEKRYAMELMGRTIDSYVQTVQATGAQFANLQAKSVGRLTGLAAIFLPASLCAAILAIPSFTHANEITKFWVFWAVSVPLCVTLVVLYISPLPGWIKKWWTERKDPERLLQASQREVPSSTEEATVRRRGFLSRKKKVPSTSGAMVHGIVGPEDSDVESGIDLSSLPRPPC